MNSIYVIYTTYKCEWSWQCSAYRCTLLLIIKLHSIFYHLQIHSCRSWMPLHHIWWSSGQNRRLGMYEETNFIIIWVYFSILVANSNLLLLRMLQCYNAMLYFQVCDVVDRVLKSPHADILKEMNPVSTIILATSMSNHAKILSDLELL